MGNWFTYNDIENIKKMYKDGRPFEEIANVIGCTDIAIETTLRVERIFIMKYTRFGDIPQFMRDANYQVNMDIRRIPIWIEENEKENGLQLNPNFQRGHVWTEEQQIAWLEFFLKGGKSGNHIYFNDPFWMDWNYEAAPSGTYKDFVCVDGLQRITSIQRFINNEIKVFGSFYKEYEDPRSLNTKGLIFHVNNLKTKKEVLQWYIDMNTGGTLHTAEEIKRVKKLIDDLE